MKWMINPKNNKRLKYFHLLVSLTFYVDFAVSSFILGNYRFSKGENENFLNH